MWNRSPPAELGTDFGLRLFACAIFQAQGLQPLGFFIAVAIAMTSRTMLTLPPLVDGSAEWRLPLCDATAMALAGALIETDLAKRAAGLIEILKIDPAFAVWAVSSTALDAANSSRQSSLLSIVEIAKRLSPRLNQSLCWPDTPPTISFTTEQHGRFAALVAESVPAARESVRGLPADEAIEEPRYLAALTAGWRDWLKASGTENTASEHSSTQFLKPWPLESVTIPNSISADSRAAGDEVWRRWLTEIPGVQTLLPALAARLHRLAELESDFDRTLQTAKLDSLKEFAYGAGHELNNPLANIASRAQTLLKEETHPERRRRLAAINTQAFRAHEMLADMMLFARPPQLTLAKVDVVRLADEVLAELTADAETQQTVLQRTGTSKTVLIDADSLQLRVALKALCINSLEALGRGGNLTIEIRQLDAIGQHPQSNPVPEETGAVEIIISDVGPGIPPEIREKIFYPFFSGRDAGRGLGFGLSKCWRIITLHGGAVTAGENSDGGAKFTIRLPKLIAGLVAFC
jgi:signal transduction histidine kinase